MLENYSHIDITIFQALHTTRIIDCYCMGVDSLKHKPSRRQDNGLGFRVFGFRVLGFRVLGFWV